MSSKEERVTDLFIRIGRPSLSRSSTRTGSTTNTAAISNTVRSDSTTPTTTSSRKSGQHATPQRGSSTPTSVSRYTISGPVPDDMRPGRPAVIDGSPQSPRPNAVHVRRHSRTLSASPSPVKGLTTRLSGAIDNPNTDTESNTPSRANQGGDSLLRTPSNNVPGSSGAISMTSTAPETTSVLLVTNDVPKTRMNSLALSASTPERNPVRSKNLVFTPSNPPPQLRLGSHSRSSSRSDRSFPPTSFPLESQDKSVAQRAVRNSLKRSHSTRVTITGSPRSASPLKNQVRGRQDLGNTEPPLFRTHQRRSQSFDVTSMRSNRSGLSTSSNATSAYENLSVRTITHYYTACPHASPPCTRPLDVQPVLDESQIPPRSTIPGLCFDCDTAERRDHESSILLGYNPRISSHMNDLSYIISRAEEMSPVSPLISFDTAQLRSLNIGDSLAPPKPQIAGPGHEEQRIRHDSQSSLVSDDDESESIAIRAQVLEDRIAELTIERDFEVRTVWKGYTQRWGPGTLGVTKGFDSDRATIMTNDTSRSNRTSINSGRSQHSIAEGRMRVDWIRDRTG